MWTSRVQNDWVLGLNPYVDPTLGEDGKIIYDPAHNSVSPNGDGILDDINEIYLSLMRNAKTLTVTYTIDGEVVQSETFGNASKTAPPLAKRSPGFTPGMARTCLTSRACPAARRFC